MRQCDFLQYFKLGYVLGLEFDSALKNLYKVKEIDISGWSTRKAGDLRLLFSTDSSLKSVKFGPGWKTSDVMDMLGMFSYCKNLNLDLFRLECPNLCQS